MSDGDEGTHNMHFTSSFIEEGVEPQELPPLLEERVPLVVEPAAAVARGLRVAYAPVLREQNVHLRLVGAVGVRARVEARAVRERVVRAVLEEHVREPHVARCRREHERSRPGAPAAARVDVGARSKQRARDLGRRGRAQRARAAGPAQLRRDRVQRRAARRASGGRVGAAREAELDELGRAAPAAQVNRGVAVLVDRAKLLRGRTADGAFDGDLGGRVRVSAIGG